MKKFSNKQSRDKLVVQFAKFLGGGGVYFVSGLAAFALFYSLQGWDWLPSKIISDVVGLSFGYLTSRYWAFSDKRLRGKNRRAGIRYVIVNAFNLAVTYVFVGVLNDAGISPYWGMLISSPFVTLWTYLLFRFWVFNLK